MSDPFPHRTSHHHLTFQDHFTTSTLDTNKWIPTYLPQWSSRERSAPRYVLRDGTLVLRIDADQQPWCPEFDGGVKVSSLQTGLFSGPVGSRVGQHRFDERLVVREAQPALRTYTPQYGYFEMRARATATPGYLCALWMIGFEETPEQSGEIAVCELFGDQISSHASEVRYGVHPWGDPTLKDEFYADRLPLDAAQFQTYAVAWTPQAIDFFVNGEHLRTIRQVIAYPMQFMLGIYELPDRLSGTPAYPQEFVIDYFRGYRLRQT